MCLPDKQQVREPYNVLGPNAPKKKIGIVSLEWRDGQQSLLGTRVRTEDMLPILPLMDEVGYVCIEMWGGATFDVALRYLGEEMASVCYWEAIRSGAEVINCDASAMALGPAHPPVESFVAALGGTPCDTGLNLELLGKINAYFLSVRKKYKEYESSFTGPDVRVLKHKIPGGMLSNLELQMKQMNASHRLGELFDEVARVSEDFGYPPLATPFAQMVGAQAAMNLFTGERYKVLSKESKNYIAGRYGLPVGPISEELREKVLGEKEMVTVRPGSLLAPGWEQAQAASRAFAHCDEDVLTYALFPDVAEGFLKRKYQAQQSQPC